MMHQQQQQPPPMAYGYGQGQAPQQPAEDKPLIDL
jgi:hypothetical protein